MPIESMLVSAAIVTVFAIFAAVLAWGQHQTGSLHKQSTAGQTKRRAF